MSLEVVLLLLEDLTDLLTSLLSFISRVVSGILLGLSLLLLGKLRHDRDVVDVRNVKSVRCLQLIIATSSTFLFIISFIVRQIRVRNIRLSIHVLVFASIRVLITTHLLIEVRVRIDLLLHGLIHLHLLNLSLSLLLSKHGEKPCTLSNVKLLPASSLYVCDELVVLRTSNPSDQLDPESCNQL